MVSRQKAKRQLKRWDRYMNRYTVRVNGFVALSWRSHGYHEAMIRYGTSGRYPLRHFVDAPRPE